MPELLLSVVVIGIILVVVGWLLIHADTAFIEDAAPESVEAPAPAVEAPVVPFPSTLKTSINSEPTYIRARFLTPAGRLLGEMNLHPKSRKPQLVYEKKGTKHICQCSHQASDGTWVYRQSGTERG